MGAENVGNGPNNVLAVSSAPHQGAVPQVLDETSKGVGRLPEEGGGPVKVDRVAADDKGLENLEMSPVEPVQCPLDAGTRAGPGGQGGQVVGSWSGQVGPTTDQFLQLIIASAPDVVGEAPEG